MQCVEISGSQLEVRHIPGPAHLSPLVFLHEGLGSVAMWQGRDKDWPLSVCQASGRAGWVYSRRGYGQSASVPDVRGANRLGADYMHLEAWQVLPQLLQSLRVEKPVLIGHSDGGSIALLHAARFEVTGVVVMAPHLFVEDISLRSIEAAKHAFETGDLRNRLSRFHADVDCAFWQWNDVWLSQAFRSFDIQKECMDISAPLLAMQGEDDIYGSLRHIEELHTVGKVKREVLQACGHSPHRDQHDLSLQLVVDFLKQLP
jgi:pimeloyl-ACP methyl ester carboxylesterase